jgi:GWxTD domain-containing protein
MNRSLVLVGTLALVLPLRQIGAAQSDRTLERVGRTGGRRIALCIGNDAYPGVPLRNAVNDARAIAGELTSAGFVVDLRLDVGREAAERAIDSFIGKLGTAEVGFFYYAGHGIQIAGENYLLPVDFDAQDEIQAKYRSYNTEQLRERMESAGSRVNVIVLDACRDNPYKLTRSGSRGWGPMNAGRGTLIALATGPGQTASDNVKEGNGLFTQHLVAAMREPGLRVQEVFDRAKEAVSEASGQRQRPWIHSDITGVVYLRPPQGATLPAGQAGPGLALDAAVVELEYWRGVQSIGTLDAYRGYKARYPSGQFADLANLQIQRLSAPVAPASAAAGQAPPGSRPDPGAVQPSQPVRPPDRPTGQSPPVPTQEPSPALLLPEEERLYRALRDDGERHEFRRIFWARRDPDLATPGNEYEATYLESKAEADALYAAAGRSGSETDCGRVHILLGKPDEITQDKRATAVSRAPEVWTYRDRPGMSFTGGQVRIAFEANCALPAGSRLREQLLRVAEAKILHPNVNYRKGPDGRIVKLEDQLPKLSAVASLLRAPRTDFPFTAEPSIVLKAEDGSSYVAGLVRGDASGLTLQNAGGKKTARIMVLAQALDAAGKSAASSTERPLTVEVGSDNHFLASFSMNVKPGDYTIRVGVVDHASGRGSAVSIPFKSPALGMGSLSASPPMLMRDVHEGVQKDPQDPLADFALGGVKLVPRYGNVFTREDSLTILAQVYVPKVGPGPHLSSNLSSTFTILRGTTVMARSEPQTGMTTPSVGPIPLQRYGPGKYVVRFEVKDNASQQEVTQEATFEVK